MKHTRLLFGIFLLACYCIGFSQSKNAAPQLLSKDAQTGLELWNTQLRHLWIPSPGTDVIKHLDWEQSVQKVYDHPSVHVLPGDVVIDCGAHIGGFTHVALKKGARIVVAVEPEQANILAFRKNFEREMRDGRVILVTKGVYDSVGKLALNISKTGDSHSVMLPQNAGSQESIEVTTIDALVKSLNLTQVNFIKMDIEGAELKALAGASQTISRLHPRMAISSYHIKGDPAAICKTIWQSAPDYLVTSKDLQKMGAVTVPKVLFFY